MTEINCHITQEHVKNDPQDAEDAVFSDYVVYLEFNGTCVMTVRADSEEEAILLAKKEWTRSDIEYTYTYEGIE